MCWACARPSARAISIAYAIASVIGRRPLRRIRSLSVSPSTYSSTMYGRGWVGSPSSPVSITATMCGCDSRATARLAPEALQLVGVGRHLAVHQLDRHLTLERLVERPVHGRHAAGRDPRLK